MQATPFAHYEDQKRLAFIKTQLQKHQQAGDKILDVGCGNGHISQALGQMGFEVKGIDVSPEAIAYAQKHHARPNVRFVCQPAETLQASGEKFSAIICSEVLEHLAQPEALLETLVQMLKPGGQLIITVPNGFGPREMLITKPVQWLHQQKPGLAHRLMRFKQTLGYSGLTAQSNAENLTHLQFFSWKSLQSLARQKSLMLMEVSPANFMEAVFPFSLLSRRFPALQKLDCKIADVLPIHWASGFYTAWQTKS